jgi:DNA-directed RNA polymerase subunit omega
MLRPSYTDLMNVMNSGSDTDNMVTSRYTVVIAAAKRARQIIDGSETMVSANSDKAVSTAVKEMYKGKVRIQLREGASDIAMPIAADELI